MAMMATLREEFMSGESIECLAKKYNIPLAEVELAIRLEWFQERIGHLQFLERIQSMLVDVAPKDAFTGPIQ
jgi:hypothetical protein